jgi:hypothetical protein
MSVGAVARAAGREDGENKWSASVLAFGLRAEHGMGIRMPRDLNMMDWHYVADYLVNGRNEGPETTGVDWRTRVKLNRGYLVCAGLAVVCGLIVWIALGEYIFWAVGVLVDLVFMLGVFALSVVSLGLLGGSVYTLYCAYNEV